MKLLICTQAVDKDHPILGFFHRWIEEFAKHCEEVHVICLIKGEYTLPPNVFVYSLGKEEGENKLKYLLRFYSYIWKLRDRYDNVFVHMNQIYAILGSFVWRSIGKRVSLWYAHGKVSLSLRVAEKMVHILFTSTDYGLQLNTKKKIVVGQGIDIVHFSPQEIKKDIDLITVGRITRSKHIHELLTLLASIRKNKNIDLTIVGDTLSKEEEGYRQELKMMAEELNLDKNVHFVGSVSHSELPSLLNRAKVFVHAAQNGSLDKAILEALACRLPLITNAPGASSLPLNQWHVLNEEDFYIQVNNILGSDVSKDTDRLRNFVIKNHSLQSLIPKMLMNFAI